MTTIRKTNYFDKFKLKKMISYLNPNIVDYYTKIFQYFPFSHIHGYLPLCMKFLPESYVIEDKKEILGMIALSPAHSNPLKLTISRLFLDNDYYNIGKQLVDFVIARYGAKGANLFLSVVNVSNDELLELFTKGCGFRQCSTKDLWLIDCSKLNHNRSSFFRIFKNSDAQDVVDLYNETLITHFKNTLNKRKEEYADAIFKGLDDNWFLKYVALDENTKKIKAFFSIITNDNENFILTITKSSWFETSFDDILSFAYKEISKRKSKFSLYVKVRKYMQNSVELENFLKEKGATLEQSQVVLVKDFYRVAKDPVKEKILLFNRVNETPAFKVQQ